VVGQQWRWSYRFPGADGIFGAVDTRRIGAENPFGIDPGDTAGADDIVIDSPVLHLPLDQSVKVLLRSKDVLHNFDVPQFRVKMDMVPGQVTYFWLTPTRPGAFEVLCQELCGIAHFAMRGLVVVEPEPAFRQWRDSFPTFASSRHVAAADLAAGQTLYLTCTACHGADGSGNAALHAPKLSGQSSDYLKRQLRNFKTEIRGTHALDEYGQQMAQIASTLADDTAIANVVAYIATLPDLPAPITMHGDARAGAAQFTTCGVCHGANARGNSGQGAPRLAGISDWYLRQQMHNFKNGLRGVHPADSYGSQMRFMAATLNSDRAIDDVIAYLNSLQDNISTAQVSAD
jgi:cytochrome c oxidase subunit 2